MSTFKSSHTSNTTTFSSGPNNNNNKNKSDEKDKSDKNYKIDEKDKNYKIDEKDSNNKESELLDSVIAPLDKISSWDELDIPTELLRGIYAYGFEKPSPIQCIAIKPIIDRKDIIGQAQSGTGKTATFSIGALSRVDLTSNTTQVLMLSPTHELTKQTAKVVKALASMMTGLRVQTMIGGSSIEGDAEFMYGAPPHIVVGCPGRVYDMMKRRHLNASKIKLVIIDEADEMLSQGFKEQIFNIFQNFNNDIQVALFSATLPSNIYEITDRFMRDPVKISIVAELLTLDGIKQYFVALNDDVQKYDTLKDIYEKISLSQCIIYCNSVKRVADLYDAMKEDNFPVCCIHSNMEKCDREVALDEFRIGSARVLISSNVTARGIDVQQVNTVINFDLPRDPHTYLHRIGRSGRWGRKGTAINFITKRDVPNIKDIESYYKIQIEELPSTF
jgi:translation initiation factor 4A